MGLLRAAWSQCPMRGGSAQVQELGTTCQISVFKVLMGKSSLELNVSSTHLSQGMRNHLLPGTGSVHQAGNGYLRREVEAGVLAGSYRAGDGLQHNGALALGSSWRTAPVLHSLSPSPAPCRGSLLVGCADTLGYSHFDNFTVTASVHRHRCAFICRNVES